MQCDLSMISLVISSATLLLAGYKQAYSAPLCLNCQQSGLSLCDLLFDTSITSITYYNSRLWYLHSPFLPSRIYCVYFPTCLDYAKLLFLLSRFLTTVLCCCVKRLSKSPLTSTNASITLLCKIQSALVSYKITFNILTLTVLQRVQNVMGSLTLGLIAFFQVYHFRLQLKKFENQLIFGDVMNVWKLRAYFLWTSEPRSLNKLN